MARTATLNVRVEPEVKAASTEILNKQGISMSTAINMFLRSIVRDKEIPREVALPHSHGVVDISNMTDEQIASFVEERTKNMEDAIPLEEFQKMVNRSILQRDDNRIA